MSANDASGHLESGGGNQSPAAKGIALVFLILTVLVTAFAGYSVFAIALPLTRPSPFFDKMTEHYFAENVPGKDKLTTDLAITLEYVNADIRTAGAQVAFALIAGLLLVTVGVLLLAAGITGQLDMAGEINNTKLKLATAAPGFAAILLGGAIILGGVLKDVSRPIDAYMSRPTGVKYEVGSAVDIPEVKAEGPATDATREH